MLMLCGCGGTDVSAFAPEDGNVWSSTPPTRRRRSTAHHKEFQQRTGIWVEVVTGGCNELSKRIALESGKSAVLRPLMFGGGSRASPPMRAASSPARRRGGVPARRGPLRGQFWTPFSSLPLVLIYNTRLVSEDEISGWADLLNPRWKGRIAFTDPTVSGSSYTAALTLFSCIEGDDWDILARLVENLDGGALSDSGEVVEKRAQRKPLHRRHAWKRLRSNSMCRRWALSTPPRVPAPCRTAARS